MSCQSSGNSWEKKYKHKRNIRLRLEQAQDRINMTSKGDVIHMKLLGEKKTKPETKRNRTNVLRNITRKKQRERKHQIIHKI